MRELDVLYAFDNNYAPFAGVSILSLLENNSDMDRIRIFAVLDKVNEENKNKLMSTVEKYSRELITIDADSVNTLLEKLGVPMYRGSYATHYRKFFHLFLPGDVEKLLYVDSDTLIVGNLSKLIEKDFEGKVAMVSLDTLGGKYKKLLGFTDEEPYFNAGVTFIDVKAWKERKYADKLIDHITNVRAKYCNPDQDLFNLVIKGDTLVVGPEYNYQPVHRVYSNEVYFKFYPRKGYYTEDVLDYAKNNMMILHAYRYMGEFPWHKGNVHPDTALFDEYLDKSAWQGYEKKQAKLTWYFKIEKFLYKVLPRKQFLFIFSKSLYHSFYSKNKRLEKNK